MRTSDLTTQPSASRGVKFGKFRQWQVEPKRCRDLVCRLLCLLMVIFICHANSPAYSVLTHEEIVDLLWKDEIRPLLIKKYPGLTDDQIKEAHAYAYGGAVIQDLGYYPFGSKEFSDLAHYVRSGDFVREMLRESQDVNEYAFALGSLAHYSSDIMGHPAVNQSVAIEFPKLRAKFGRFVLYSQDKTAHLKTEFGFDMAQVAKNRYASDQYHDFIGFQVSKPLLDRTFPVIYGMQVKDVISHEDLAIGSYRWAISRLIPQMTRVALQTHKKEMIKEHPDFAKQKFLYRLSRTAYEKEWGKDYTRPGIGARMLAAVFRFMPKIGPFKGLGFKNPTPQTEDLYFKSINATVDQYRSFLHEVKADSLRLTNCDLDSGKVTKAGEYNLADDVYAKMLHQLAGHNFDGLTPQLKDNILLFYKDQAAVAPTKKSAANAKNIQSDLEKLKAAKADAQKSDSPREDIGEGPGGTQVCSAAQVKTVDAGSK